MFNTSLKTGLRHTWWGIREADFLEKAEFKS